MRELQRRDINAEKQRDSKKKYDGKETEKRENIRADRRREENIRGERGKGTGARRPAMAALIFGLILGGMVLSSCGGSDKALRSAADASDAAQEYYSLSEEEEVASAVDANADEGNGAYAGTDEQTTITPEDVPEYSGEPYIVLNDNEPAFSDDDLTEEPFEIYAGIDSLGRCGVAYANICTEIMPTEKRGSIGQIKPSGWHTVKYDEVDGKYLYNRCHLIGYQLAGENANEKNLITGTRYMNVEGMLPFENMVDDYVVETDNHVLYRVTPIFDGDNLVASGVQMEAMSVEDEGEGILFNVYVYNVQPGIEIDYATGESREEESTSGDGSSGTSDTAAAEGEIRGNSKSKIYHCPGQTSYEDMADSKNLVVFRTEQEAIDAGYRKAKR